MNPDQDRGLQFLRRILTEPSDPRRVSRLESQLLEAELDLIERGKAELGWSDLLSAAEAYWNELSLNDQRLLGTPRDILNRWALNGSFFLELDEALDRLSVHTSDSSE